MKLLWFVYIFEVLILTLIRPYVFNFEAVAIIAVLLNVIVSIAILYITNTEIRQILILGYLARVAALFWDLYARNFLVFPGSGADTEMFYGNAVRISNNISLLGTTRGETYSDILGLIFYLIGPQRPFGQYLNVLLGISTIIVIFKTLKLLKFDTEIIQVLIVTATFFPNSIILSAVFLRELFPTFFVSVSLYYFIKWFIKGYSKYMVKTLIFLILASVFHSGVIGIALGYIFAFLFYNHESKTFQANLKTVLTYFLILIIFIPSLTVLEETIFRKFSNVEGIDDIYHTATPTGEGGAAYLKGIEINNFGQFLLYSPVKSFYFVVSPLPWNWRGISDIFTFFFDSLLYFTIIYKYLKVNKSIMYNQRLALSLFIMIIGSIFIFGIGVSNAGTALRHRQKLLPIFIVLLGVLKENSKIINFRKK